MLGDRLRRALREPLLHFALLGTALFGAWHVGQARTASEQAATIVVSRATQARLATELETKLRRPPSEAELAAAIERWSDGELLYREGLALGLDRDDPVVRQRVIQKMEFVGDNLELPAEPDEATLRAYLEERPERFTGPPRYDFVLVSLARAPDELDDARAQQVLAQLRAGADPKTVGGRFASGRLFSAANLAGTYGPELAAAVTELPPGEWGLLAVARGWTLVSLQAVHPGEAAAFENVRNRVLLDWKSTQRGLAREQQLEALRGRYAVRLEP